MSTFTASIYTIIFNPSAFIGRGIPVYFQAADGNRPAEGDQNEEFSKKGHTEQKHQT